MRRDHADGTRRGDRPRGRPRARGRRLRDEAVLAPRGRRARSRGASALGRRTAPEEPVAVAGDLEIDLERRELREATSRYGSPGRSSTSSPPCIDRPGVTRSRELLEDVWDFAWDGDTATVTVHVRRLREKIEEDPSNPAHLVTVWGVGLPVRSMSDRGRELAHRARPRVAAAGVAGTLVVGAAMGMGAGERSDHLARTRAGRPRHGRGAVRHEAPADARIAAPAVRRRRALAAAVALANLWVLSRPMFVSEHDATLVAVLLLYSVGAGIGAAVVIARSSAGGEG